MRLRDSILFKHTARLCENELWSGDIHLAISGGMHMACCVRDVHPGLPGGTSVQHVVDMTSSMILMNSVFV